MATPNHFEAVARSRKVARLVRHLTELFEMLNLHPERDGQLMAELLRGWGDAEWNSACINTGMQSRGNKPLCSFVTRLEVIGRFAGAQRKAAS